MSTRLHNFSLSGCHMEIFIKPANIKAIAPALESKLYSFIYKNGWRIKPSSITLANIIWSVGRKRWSSFFSPYIFTLFASEPWSNKLWYSDSYYILVPIKNISWFNSWQHTITFLPISNFSKNFLVSRGKLFHHYKKKNLIFPSNFLTVLEESIYNAAIWFCRIRMKKRAVAAELLDHTSSKNLFKNSKQH